MATLIRVKRRITEEPADALTIQCKRMRANDEASVPIIEEINNCFNFVGTVPCKDDSVGKFLNTPKCKNLKRRKVDIMKKARDETKLNTQNKRFKLVTTCRGLDATKLDDEFAEENDQSSFYSILDVVEEGDDESVKETAKEPDTITCNGVVMKRLVNVVASSEDYVYDVYVDDFKWDDLILRQSVTIKASENELVTHESDDDEVPTDDDDSNDENYYKNDYPDEDSDFENDRDYWATYEEDDVVKDLAEFNLASDDEDELINSKTNDDG